MGNDVSHFPESQEKRLAKAIMLLESENVREALDLFIELIDDGNNEAYYFVGCIYEEGENGIKQDLEKAFFYYKKSVDEFGYVEGYLALGRFYFYGIGIEQDYNKAFEYYSWVDKEKANPIAQMMLGRMYKDGLGVKKDLEKSREFLCKAANKGNVYAIKELAHLEGELGHYIRSLMYRIKAGLSAFLIGRKNMFDSRLRPG